LSNRTGSNGRHEAKSQHDRKYKRKNYTSAIYGARLEFEDARILDDYGRANKLDRSAVVRLGLHQFALRQQMHHHKKDPLRETLEQIVAEKIEPLFNRIEEVVAVLHEVAQAVIQIRQQSKHMPHNGIEIAHMEAEVARGQKPLIEQTLMAVMLVLRLHINYVVEPILRETHMRSSGGAEAHLRAAIQGRDGWCETTREVITRTGKRILFELNSITKEDWERLLDTYEKTGRG
jgi:hypothetical protein